MPKNKKTDGRYAASETMVVIDKSKHSSTSDFISLQGIIENVKILLNINIEVLFINQIYR